MSTEQPVALRLADALEENSAHNYDTVIDEASDELRRLHAENEQLRRQLAVRGEPVASVHPNNLAATGKPWCREVLLYSGDNTGDWPEKRVPLYAAPPGTDALLDQALKALEVNCSGNTQGLAKDTIAAIRKYRGLA